MTGNCTYAGWAWKLLEDADTGDHDQMRARMSVAQAEDRPVAARGRRNSAGSRVTTERTTTAGTPKSAAPGDHDDRADRHRRSARVQLDRGESHAIVRAAKTARPQPIVVVNGVGQVRIRAPVASTTSKPMYHGVQRLGRYTGVVVATGGRRGLLRRHLIVTVERDGKVGDQRHVRRVRRTGQHDPVAAESFGPIQPRRRRRMISLARSDADAPRPATPKLIVTWIGVVLVATSKRAASIAGGWPSTPPRARPREPSGHQDRGYSSPPKRATTSYLHHIALEMLATPTSTDRRPGGPVCC